MVFTETTHQPEQYLSSPTWELISIIENLQHYFFKLNRPISCNNSPISVPSRSYLIWKTKKKPIFLVRSNVRIYLTLGGAWFIAILIGISPFFLPNTRYARAPSLLVVGQGPAFYVIYGKAMIKLFAILPKSKV